MKNIYAAIIMTLFSASATLAEENFYSKSTSGDWYVFGTVGDDTLHPACYATVEWQDGSKIQVIKDLKDGEFYIWIKNNTWNIQDEIDSYYDAEINFTNSRGVVNLKAEYLLINKNTIAIRDVIIDNFIDPFMIATEMEIIMPGTIQNAYVTLNGSREAVAKIVECIEIFDKKISTKDTI